MQRTHRLYETLEARNLLAADALGDDYVNVAVDEACVISELNPISGRIEIAGDIDVFAFNGVAGQVLRFDVSSEELPELRSDIFLLSGWNYESRYQNSLTWKVPLDGRYFFRVSSQNAIGDYAISMTSSQDVPDAVSDATPLLVDGIKIKDELEVVGDVDVFALPVIESRDLREGTEVVVKFSRITTQQYPVIRVIDSNVGRRVIAEERGAELTFSATPRGVYHVEVASGGAQGEYELEFEVITDDHSASVDGTSRVLQVNDTFSGRVVNRYDVDAFAFRAVEGAIYRVEEITPSNGRLSISGYSASGQRVATTTESRSIAWKASESGLSKIEVSTHHQADVQSSLPYEFALTEVVDDLPGEVADGSADFGVLAPGVRATKSATFDYIRDEDVFAVELATGDNLRIMLTSLEDDQGIGSLRLLAPDGSEVPAYRNGRTTNLTWKAEQDGRYVIKAVSNRFRSRYELSAEVVEDDYPDDPTSETPELRFGESFSGVVEANGDVDVFHLRLEAEQSIAFPSTAGSWSGIIRVVAPSGEVVPSLAARWRAFEAGLHRVEISHEQRTGEYALTPTLIGRDDHANTMSRWVSELPRNVPTTVTIEERADVDVLSFGAVIGETFEVTVDAVDAELSGLVTSIFHPERGGSGFVDSRFIWKAPRTGPFSLKVQAREAGSLTIRLRLIATDDHADYANELATELQDGETMSGTMLAGARGDVDVFAYHAMEGDVLQVSFQRDSADVRIGVRDYWTNLRDTTVVIAKDTGPIYIEVQSLNPSEYALTMEKIGVDVPQSLDETAPSIPLGTLVTGQLETHDDNDVYAFDAVAGQAYVMYSDLRNFTRDFHMVSADGDQLQLGQWVRLTDKRVLWNANATGRHYFRAKGGAAGAGYTFSIEEADPKLIDFGSLLGDFEHDYGFLTFVAMADQTFNLKLDFSDSNPSANVRIFRTDRLRNSVAYVEVTSAFTHDLFFQPEAAEYLVAITSSSPKLGSYSGMFVDLSEDVVSDVFQAPATLVPRAGEVEGEIVHPFDEDVFEVNVLEDEVLRLQLSPTSSRSKNLALHVFAPDGIAIDTGRSPVSEVTLKAEQSGRYRIVVSGHYGSYRLTTSSTLDLHADDKNGATTSIVAGQPVMGVLEFNRDVDLFHIDVEADTVYQLRMPAMPKHLWLQIEDAAGNHVPQSHVADLICNIRFPFAGRYYFRFWESGLPDHQSLAYEFVLEQLQDDSDSVPTEANGTQDELRSLQVGMPLDGAFETRHDVDVFALDLEPHDRFKVHVVAENLAPVVLAISEDGDVVFQEISDAGLVTSETGGRFYVELTSRGDLQEYTLEITRDEILQLPDDLLPAPMLTFGERYFDEFTNSVDQRLFEFTATEGIIYRVTGPRAYVMRPTGERLPTVRHGHRDGVVYYDWKAEESGQFYLVVDPDSFGPYSFTLREFQDDIPNLPTSKVPVIAFGEQHSGLFNTQTDVDVIAFDVIAGDVFTVDAKWDGLSLHDLRVLGPDGTTELDAVNESVYRSNVAGRHFLELNSKGRLGPHHVLLELAAGGGAIDVPDEASLLSPTLTLDEQIAGSFYHSVDIDVFAFDAIAGRTVEVVVEGRKVIMSVIGPDGGEAVHVFGKIWTPQSTGRYFVVLRPAGNALGDQTENYTAEIRQSPVQLPASELAIFPPADSDGTLTGEFERVGQRQRFAIYAKQGDTVRLDVESESDIRLHVVGRDTTGDESVIWRVQETGRHLVDVTAREPGPYRIRFQSNEKSIDDHSNFIDGTIAEELATPLKLNQANLGVLEVRNDIDVFSLNAFLGQRIVFDVEASWSIDVRLFAADRTHLGTIKEGGFEWIAPHAGSYYVEITSSASAALSYTLTAETDGRSSDLDGDGIFSAKDIDALFSAIDNPPSDAFTDPALDINADGLIDGMDRISYFHHFDIVTGDANLDGRVNFADFLILSKSFQSSGGWESGDFNGDNRIGFADFLLLANAFGTISRR